MGNHHRRDKACKPAALVHHDRVDPVTPRVLVYIGGRRHRRRMELLKLATELTPAALVGRVQAHVHALTELVNDDSGKQLVQHEGGDEHVRNEKKAARVQIAVLEWLHAAQVGVAR